MTGPQLAPVYEFGTARCKCWCTKEYVRVPWVDVRRCLTLPCKLPVCRAMNDEERVLRADR